MPHELLGAENGLAVWLTPTRNKQQTRRRRYRKLDELSVRRTKASTCSEVWRAPGTRRQSRSEIWLARNNLAEGIKCPGRLD